MKKLLLLLLFTHEHTQAFYNIFIFFVYQFAQMLNMTTTIEI